jgi:hypothetical protein
MNMTEMLNATIARHAELQAAEPKRHIWMCGKTFEIDGVGKVWCGIQDVAGVYRTRAHWRRSWELNGKRVAAAKLAEIIGA